MQTFEGRTADAEAPFLSGSFWTVGKTIRGSVSRRFETVIDGKTSPAIVLDLEESVEVDGEDWDRVSVGNLAGIRMAAQSAKDEQGKSAPIVLKVKDVIEIECESIKPAKKEG